MLPKNWEKVEYGFVRQILPSFFFVINYDTCHSQAESDVKFRPMGPMYRRLDLGSPIIDILIIAADSQYNMYQRLLEYKQELCERMTVEYKILLWSKTMLSVKNLRTMITMYKGGQCEWECRLDEWKHDIGCMIETSRLQRENDQRKRRKVDVGEKSDNQKRGDFERRNVQDHLWPQPHWHVRLLPSLVSSLRQRNGERSEKCWRREGRFLGAWRFRLLRVMWMHRRRSEGTRSARWCRPRGRFVAWRRKLGNRSSRRMWWCSGSRCMRVEKLDSVGAAGEGRGRHSVQKTLMVAENVGFCNAKLKVEDIKVFTLNATNVTFAKNTSAKCPMDILECGIIQILQGRMSDWSGKERWRQCAYLGSYDDGTKEDSFQGPFFEGNMEMRLSPVDVDEGSKDGLDINLCTLYDIFDKWSELCMFRAACAGWRGRRTSHCEINCLYDWVDKIFWERSKLWWQRERRKDIRMTGRESLIVVSSRRAGEWVAGSTREFGWTGDVEGMFAGAVSLAHCPPHI